MNSKDKVLQIIERLSGSPFTLIEVQQVYNEKTYHIPNPGSAYRSVCVVYVEKLCKEGKI